MGARVAVSNIIARVMEWAEEDADREIARMLVAILFCVVVPVCLVVGGVIAIIEAGKAIWLSPLALVALYGVWRFIKWLFKIERKTNGSDRQAEEDSQDPDPDPWTSAVKSAIGSLNVPITFSATSANPYATSPRPDVEPKQELEVVESDLPILAHRAAELIFAGTDKHWRSVNSGFGVFGVDADARCQMQERFHVTIAGPRYSSHTAPVVGCDCGFYALPPDLRSTFEGVNYVTLLVELSGTVIEHEEGYRGQHQRVVECELPPCPFCGGQAEHVVVNPENRMHEAVCARHVPVLPEGHVLVSSDDVAALLPVPVTRAGRRVDA